MTASIAGISIAVPISAGVVIPRSSSARPIAMRKRIVASRSCCRIRPLAAERRTLVVIVHVVVGPLVLVLGVVRL